MDDIGLQRAILASIQSTRTVVYVAPRPAPISRPSRDIFPAQPSTRTPMGVGRKSTCEREGILPRVGSNSSKSLVPAGGGNAGRRTVSEPRLMHPVNYTNPEDGTPASTDANGGGGDPTPQAGGAATRASYQSPKGKGLPPPATTTRQTTNNAAQRGGGKGAPSGGRSTNNPNEESLATNQFEQAIEEEILDRSPNVQWEDIASLQEPKRLLNEAVVLPLLMPGLFTGLRAPWKGVLLYGPPGTGKTMLARAVATCGKTTFFNMSAAALLSRYHGESEKMVKALFAMARAHAPSTIFFDEIDALVGSRGDGKEHEVTRRVKTELLMQMDGIATGNRGDGGPNSGPNNGRIMVLATTNRPWDIDEAMRRRLEKRIYVPLPDAEARGELIKLHTKTVQLSEDVDLSEIVGATDGYSGADILTVCREAAMMPLRRAIAGLTPQQMQEISEQLQQSNGGVVMMQDFRDALKRVNASVSKDELTKYEEWTKEFAST